MKENKSQDHTQSHPDQKKTWRKGPGDTATDTVGLRLREDSENEGSRQGLEGPAQLNLSHRRFKSPEHSFSSGSVCQVEMARCSLVSKVLKAERMLQCGRRPTAPAARRGSHPPPLKSSGHL